MWHTICHRGKATDALCVCRGRERAAAAVETHVPSPLTNMCTKTNFILFDVENYHNKSCVRTTRSVHGRDCVCCKPNKLPNDPHIVTGATRTSAILVHDKEGLQKECSNENSVATAARPLYCPQICFALILKSPNSQPDADMHNFERTKSKRWRVWVLRSTSSSICTYATARSYGIIDAMIYCVAAHLPQVSRTE